MDAVSASAAATGAVGDGGGGAGGVVARRRTRRPHITADVAVYAGIREDRAHGAHEVRGASRVASCGQPRDVGALGGADQRLYGR